tara:strand:- start:144 stop:731 length:588 start_codon:yes stop_codon:yes gene_type:complete
MPTGYTAEVQKGISFNKYALNCARAFGALITMRDEPSDKEIPEKLEPSDYHFKAKVKAEDSLSALNSLSSEAANKKALDAFNSAELNRTEKLKEEATIEVRYNEMLSKAKLWESPSKDHDKLKEFMVSQLEESIRFDCGSSYYEKPTVKLTGKQWRSEQIERAHKDIAYQIKNYREEVERTDSRNKWIDLLRDSI